jgi:hypothetical protein
MVDVEIGEYLETESAGEPEQDEVAAGAQESLAGRRCLHVRQHYRPGTGLAGAKGHALIFLSEEQKRRHGSSPVSVLRRRACTRPIAHEWHKPAQIRSLAALSELSAKPPLGGDPPSSHRLQPR